MIVSKGMSRGECHWEPCVLFWVLPIGFAGQGELTNPYSVLWRGLKIDPVDSNMFPHSRRANRDVKKHHPGAEGLTSLKYRVTKQLPKPDLAILCQPI